MARGVKLIKKLITTIPNIGRSICAMIFSAVVFLLLKHSGDKGILITYSWFLVTANLFVTFTGWGLRDYSVKEYVKNLSASSSQFSLLLVSKIPLLIISFCIIIFIPATVFFKISLFLLVFLRTMLALVDPLVLVFNRTLKVFAWESLVYILAIMALCFFGGMRLYIIHILLLIEMFRLIISFTCVHKEATVKIKWINTFGFLIKTRFYLGIALFSFCMSRIDVYVLGWRSNSDFFADYTIILNLIAFSQIIIASVYNHSIKSIFRLTLSEAGVILNKLFIQFFFLSLAATLTIIAISIFVYEIRLSRLFYLLLFINIFFYCLTLKYVYILNHSNKPSYFLTGAIISSFVNILCAVILVPLLGINGAIISNTLGVIVLVSVLYLIVSVKGILVAKK